MSDGGGIFACGLCTREREKDALGVAQLEAKRYPPAQEKESIATKKPPGATHEEATAADLLDALLTSFLPAIRSNVNEKIFDMVTSGESIKAGPVEIFVERKVKKEGYVQLVGGIGIHTGDINRDNKAADVAPLVAAEIVKKLDVEVRSVKAGAAVEAPSNPLDAFKNLFGSATVDPDAEVDGALVVEAQLDFYVHFEKGRQTGEEANQIHNKLVSAVMSNDQTGVGDNAIEFRAMGVRAEVKHFELNARVRLWIDFARQEVRIAFLERPAVDVDLEIDVVCVNLPDLIEDTVPEALLAGVCASWNVNNPLVVSIKPKEEEAEEEEAKEEVQAEAGAAPSAELKASEARADAAEAKAAAARRLAHAAVANAEAAEAKAAALAVQLEQMRAALAAVSEQPTEQPTAGPTEQLQ